ncbi:MAG: efflux RND transporter permease subunit, partial [Planctomycetota bacterium]
MVDRILKLCLQTPILVLIMTALVVVFGFQSLQDNPKDAIPDISENQVIVSTMWMGATPQDMEDQVTYPLAQQLQGIPKIVDVRTMSGFGMSRIYVVFEDGVDVYWARSRVLERLAVAAGTLPDGVKPALGPDATSLGQVYQYTVEGPYDLAELRTIQDYTVKYALQNAKGVAEVASVGGHVREYQIDVDPDVLRAHGLTLKHLAMALKMSNQDVGAKTLEQGGLEYLIRGVGFIKSLEDIEQIVVKNDGHIPVTIGDVATIQYGAEFRRGALADDKGEVVGGIVTMRYGANPQSVIDNIKEEIRKLEPALPKGVVIKPFYDRSQLIDETLETLTSTILAEILITVFVVVLFLLHLRSGLIISSTIPLSVLLAFIGMEAFGVGSNIMSLGGIIIAIGTVVDMGIIMTETIYRALVDDGGKSKRFDVVYAASREVGGAVFTAVLTTVISFVPIFFLTGQSYKLFSPLAWTKTFMLLSAAILAITLIPVLCYLFLGGRKKVASPRFLLARKLFGWASSLAFGSLLAWVALRFNGWFEANIGIQIWFIAAALFVLGTLVVHRMWDEKLTPMDDSPVSKAIVKSYRPALGFCLRNKWILGCVYVGFLLWGAVAMLGARTVLFPFYDDEPTKALPLAALDEHYPGFGSEFMPPLDEGSLLFMPSTLSQAGIGETLKVMEWENEQIAKVPEVTQVVGKLGRAETSLDPAPIGMIETIVNLKPKKDWRKEVPQELLVVRLRRQWHESDLRREMREGSTKEAIIEALHDGLTLNKLADQVEAADDVDALRELKESGKTLTLGEQLIINLSRDLTQKSLIADLRQVTRQPGVAPSWLQPIETRIIMLSSGIKARIGLELVGNNAAELAELALKLEPMIKEVDGTSDVTA